MPMIMRDLPQTKKPETAEFRVKRILDARMLWTLASSARWKSHVGKGWQRR